MRTVTEFPRGIVEWPDVGISMPDGCRLSARIWLPEDAGTRPVPAILEHLPYRKRDGTAARDALTHPYFAGHGYASIRVDMRGNGDSEGLMEDEYSEQELDDACRVIAWARRQPWCNGRVGMMGISWGGFNSLQVAAKQPPGLEAVITLCSTDDRYADDIHYKGGLLLNENLGWGATMLSYSSRPPDPLVVGAERWRELWLERLENEPFLPAVWLKHQRRDAYWKRGSICEDFSDVQAATLAVGGWGDAYKNAVARIVDGITAPAKGILGPWVHKYPHFAVPQPAIGFLQEALRWWDRWLKDIDTKVEAEPRLRVYVMDSVRPRRWYEDRPGRWIGLDGWREPGEGGLTLAAGPGGTLGPEAGDLGAGIAVASPQDCGLAGGEYCAIWLGPEMPGDQRPDDERSAVFDTAPLSAALDIVGTPVLSLRLSADRPQAMVAARLCEVHSDGASTRISYAVFNLGHRFGHDTVSPVVPGEIMEVELRLDDVAYRAAAGNRLRLALSSAYWPLVWPSPQTVTLTLHSAELALPTVGDQTTDIGFADPEGARPWQIEIVRESAHRREIEPDQTNGTVRLDILDDFGEVRDLEHGLVSGSVARESWTIHPADPLSARGEAHWTQTLSRGEWAIRTEAFSRMRCDARNFHLTGRLLAYEGDSLVFERNFDELIARDGI